MVDVKTLTTEQAIFDYVATHLLTQGKAAISNYGTCYYRAPNGTSCAVGCLMTDREYTPDFEEMSVCDLLDMFPKRAFLKRMADFIDLLYELQHVHDNIDLRIEFNRDEFNIPKLKDALRNVARQFMLDTKVLD